MYWRQCAIHSVSQQKEIQMHSYLPRDMSTKEDKVRCTIIPNRLYLFTHGFLWTFVIFRVRGVSEVRMKGLVFTILSENLSLSLSLSLSLTFFLFISCKVAYVRLLSWNMHQFVFCWWRCLVDVCYSAHFGKSKCCLQQSRQAMHGCTLCLCRWNLCLRRRLRAYPRFSLL